MLFVLNRQEKVINILKNHGNNSSLSPYFDDNLVEMLNTGAETFSFSTIAQGNLFKDLVVGNYIAFKKGKSYKLFQIVQVETRHEDEMIISVYCECAGLDLINKIFRARTINSCSLRKFIDALVEDTGWNTGLIDISLQKTFDLELEDDTVYSTLQNNIGKFEGEIEFRVELKNGQISNKFIDVYANRGKVTGKRFTFGKDIEGITRKVDSTSLYTALKGVGKNSLSFRNVQVEGIDKPIGQDFVADQASYEKYNNNGYHVIGIYEYDTESPEELLRETYKQLQKVKEPKVTYEIPVALLAELLGKDWEKINIGDTVSIFDNAFNPPLMLMARVSELQTSETNPYANSCTFTNFIEVSSNITSEMRKLASKLEGYVDTSVSNKFPIGSDDIQEGAINGTHIYQNSITVDHLSAECVTADKILAGEIKAEHIAADSIDAGHIKAGIIDATHIKAEAIDANHIKADAIKAEHLQANIINAEHIQTGSITAGSGIIADGAIGAAQINSVNANVINAGEIDTSKIKIKGENGFLFIENNTLYVVDENRKIRCELGVIEKGTNYGFIVRGSDGQTILMDHTGVKNAGITDGAIDNRTVSENANINGKKLDIDSVIRTINEDGSIKIQGTTVQIGNMTLDVLLSEQNNLITEHTSQLQTHQSEIKANKDSIKLKVDSQTYTEDKENMTAQLNKNTAAIKTLKDEISLKVEQAQVEATVNSAMKDFTEQIQDTNDRIDDILDNVGGAIADGIVDEAEALIIQNNIDQLNKEKTELTERYNYLYANSKLKGSAKTNLKSAYDNFINKHTALINTINSIIADKKITDTEKTSYNNNLQQYSNALSLLNKRFDEAIDSINTEKVNASASEIKITTDAITQSVTNLETAVSKKADGSTVTTLSNNLSSLETSVNGIKGTVSSLETTTSDNANLIKTIDGKVVTLDKKVEESTSKVSELNVNLDKITQRVSSTETNITTIQNMKIGGRNYIKDYQFEYPDVWLKNNASVDTENKRGQLTGTTNTSWLYQEYKNNEFKVGDKLTLQYEMKCENVSASTGSNSFLIRTQLTGYTADGSHIADVLIFKKHESECSEFSDWKKVIVTGVVGNYNFDFTRMRLYARNFNGKIYFRNVKLEIGEKATDLSPAPEDIDSAIGTKANASDVYNKTEVYTKAETNSQINVAKNEINLGVSKIEEISKITSIAKVMNIDVDFRSGLNGISTYNNAGNGNVVLSRVAKSSECPTKSTHMIQITTSGSASPGHGGFTFETSSRANAVFITKFLAKIPSGYSLSWHSNPTGDGGKHEWLTSTAGTGKWTEYICKVTCGASGSFSSTNFFALNGGSAPVTWYLGMATVYDLTDSNQIERRMESAEQKITPTAIINTVNTQIGEGGEINTVSTVLNKEGLTVNNGALRVKNNAGNTVLSGDSNGNLTLAGNITSNATIKGGTISGTTVTGGKLKSTNGDMYFDMNNGYMILYNNGTKIGQTNKNNISGTTIYGVSNGAEYGSYACLSAKIRSSAANYQMMITASGCDLSDANLKKGITLGHTFHSNNWHFKLGSSTELCWRQNGSNHDSFITEGSDGMLRLFGDNGMYLGYRVGDSNTFVIAIRENGSHTYPKSLSIFDGDRPATDNNGYSLEISAPLNMKGQSINQCSNIKTLGLEFIEPIAFNGDGEDETRTLKVTKNTQNIVEFIGSTAIKNGEAIVDLPNDVSFKNYVVLLTPIGLDRKVSMVEKNDDNFKIVGNDGIVDYVIKFESMDYASYISKSISEDNTDIIVRGEEDKPKEIFIEN